MTDKDASGNIISGNVIDIDSTDSVIYADKRLVATIGLKDTIVVDTPDRRWSAAATGLRTSKKVVDELKKRKPKSVSPTARSIGPGQLYHPGGRRPLQDQASRGDPRCKAFPSAPHHRSDTGRRLRDRRVTNADKEYDVHTNESTYIPMSTKHRLENPGKVPSRSSKCRR